MKPEKTDNFHEKAQNNQAARSLEKPADSDRTEFHWSSLPILRCPFRLVDCIGWPAVHLSRFMCAVSRPGRDRQLILPTEDRPIMPAINRDLGHAMARSRATCNPAGGVRGSRLSLLAISA